MLLPNFSYSLFSIYEHELVSNTPNELYSDTSDITVNVAFNAQTKRSSSIDKEVFLTTSDAIKRINFTINEGDNDRGTFSQPTTNREEGVKLQASLMCARSYCKEREKKPSRILKAYQGTYSTNSVCELKITQYLL